MIKGGKILTKNKRTESYLSTKNLERYQLLTSKIKPELPKAVLAGTSPPFSVLIKQNDTHEQNTIIVRGV